MAGTLEDMVNKLIHDLWPRADGRQIDGIVNTCGQVFEEFEINTTLRMLHLFTQISAETDGGVITKESMYYTTVSRLRAVWPSRFVNMSDAEASTYLRNEHKLANFVYGARMGNQDNGTDDDDGYYFRGQGLLQTTGKALYRQLGEAVGLDLVTNPEYVIDPRYALRCATGDFAIICKCLPYADADDLLSVSALVNVGHVVSDPKKVNGWQNRRVWYSRWKAAIDGYMG